MENNEGKLAAASGDMPVGRWTINQSKCTTCCECIDACLRGLLALENNVIVMKNEKICDQCGDCASACAYRAIVLT
ncbi:hypothetical protein AAE250_05510 [Bacteroides sp. GD17]|jgi:ferredoxin|uniref:hypothetical protein n=1 Tax=Bacteroides sp. GD17 TaxID=3139826 RepID=UPI00313DE498